MMNLILIPRRLLAISLILLAASLLSAQYAYAGTLVSSVNRNAMSTNETLNLVVRYDESVENEELDLSGLNNDFEILSVRPNSSSSVRYINGDVEREVSMTWNVTLAAKRSGQLTIPAFDVNGDKSQPIIINAQDGAALSASDQPLQAFVSASHESVYPSQQLIVDIELSAKADVSDLNGGALVVNGADVEELGQKQFQRLDNGVVRQIVVLKYAVFAKQPGKLIIPVMSFGGIQGGQRSVFGTSRGQRVIARTSQLEIDVKPIDANQSPWFPAENVRIESQWSGDKTAIRVGEPITRSIRVTAAAQRASVIPPLANPAVGYKSYKDQPQLDSQATDAGFIGTRTESEAIVASEPGELILPEIRTKWWNVNTQKWQNAILPSEVITVLPAVSSVPNSAQPTFGDTNAQAPFSGTIVEQQATHWWWKLAVLLLAIICIVQSVLIVRLLKREKQPSTNNHHDSNQSEAKAWKQVKKALSSSDANLARQSLLVWAQVVSPTTHSVQ